MPTREQSAAQTRHSLLDAASALLDRGGPDAVTLREVGSGAGVSRTAPYRHFADKGDLLVALAAAGWADLADDLRALADDSDAPPAATLRRALGLLVHLGRTRPHRYRLMFGGTGVPPEHAAGEAPATTAASAAVTTAASSAQDAFLVLVERAVGGDRARPLAGVLLAATHGVVDLDVGGHLPTAKWGADADALLDLLVATLAGS